MPTSKMTMTPKLAAEKRCSNEECKLRDAILTHLREMKRLRRIAAINGGQMPVRFADVAKALGIKRKDERRLDRALQWLRKQKKIRYASRAGWEIWE